MHNIIKKFLIIFFKIFIVSLSFFYIKHHWDTHEVFFILPPINFFKFLFLMIILSSLNWFLEIKKWQILVQNIQPTNFYIALKQSLISYVGSMVTPNRMGEYGLKILFFDKGSLKKIILLQSIQSISQLFATFFFGFLGCLYYGYFFIAFIICLIFMLFLFFRKFNFLPDRIILFFNKIQKFSHHNYKQVFSLSLIKYIVFSTQFLMLMYWFGVDVSLIKLFSTLTLMYLFSSVLPTLQFFDVMIKGSVGVFVFEKIGISSAIIIQVSFLMWFFNMLLPYLFGLIFWFKFKTKWI